MSLNTADQRLIQREAGLPGLAWLLDADRFAELADQVCPEAGITAAEQTYLRYKPGTSALAAFRLHRVDAAPLLVQAKALPAGRFETVAARLSGLKPDPDFGSGFGPPDPAPAAVAPLQLVLLRPCDDRKLKAIGPWQNPLQRERLLAGLNRLADAPRLAPDALTLLRYKPERRLVARLDQAGKPVALLRILGRSHFGQGLLGASFGAASSGAPLLAADAHHQTLVLGWTAGTTLSCDGAGDDALRRTGQQLAQLHRTRSLPPLQRGRRAEAEAVRRALAMLAHLEPAFEARCRDRIHRTARLLEASPWQPALIHGDFSADQVIVDGERCRFIDWDRSAAGDAAADLGSFAARLEADVLHGRLERGTADHAFAQLLEGYSDVAPVAEAAVNLQTAVSLLLLVTESFRLRLADWPDREDVLLSRAEALLNRVEPRPGGGAVVAAIGATGATGLLGHAQGHAQGRSQGPTLESARAPGPDPRPDSTLNPDLNRALDPAWIGPALQRALGPTWQNMRLASARLLRHKPGRRALIAFDLVEETPAQPRSQTRSQTQPQTQTVLGKLRFKGLDRNGFEVQRALAQRALRPGQIRPPTTARAVVPEVLGSLPELGLWLQRALPGEPCCPFFQPGADTALARQIADALADLHDNPVATLRNWTVKDELEVLQERLARAAIDRPDLASRIDAVLSACKRCAAQLPATPLTGIHRDFHPGQVLVDAQRLVLLDFDLYALGDPALDVGNFVAHLSELAIRLHGDAEALVEHQHALIDQYHRRRPGVSTQAISDWFCLSLARHIDLSLRYPDRLATTARLLERCEKLLLTTDPIS